MQSCSQESHWVEIQLQDENGQPVPGEPYVVTLPNGEVVQGTLDDNGFARIAVFAEAGDCTVNFPNIDSDAWQYDSSEGPEPSES